MWNDGDAGEPLLTDAEPALHRRVAVSGPQRPAVGGRRGEVPGVDIGFGVGRAQRCVSPVLQRMVRLCSLRDTLPLVLILKKNTNFTCWTPQCLMRHAGTRLCAQQLAILLTTCCRICGIPLVNFRNSAVVRFPLIGATSAAVRPAPRLPALVRFPMGGNPVNLPFAAVCDCYVPLAHILSARGSRFKWGG